MTRANKFSTSSFDDSTPVVASDGQHAHPLAVQHSERLTEKLYQVGEQTWCLVGNGLSNQTFILGPEGIIAVDTGESVEEMRAALAHLRKVTQAPIVAVIYSHFHYVNGTAAILEEPSAKDVQIYAHTGIPGNLARFGGEVAPRSNRGLVHQFGVALPTEGEDALLHCGLGLHLRNPDHAPFTPGYVQAQHEFDQPCEIRMAGLNVIMTPAPSDATDSITIWIPELQLCVNNLVWPALFNIYAIRGEQYRDPRILLTGIDHIASLDAQHLVGAHGPPLSNPGVSTAVQTYRDSIQFIWDQTVRGANLGLTLDELVAFVQLPEHFNDHYYTQQLYGVVEHHVRQIYTGLFGWFDEDEGHLFPLPGQQRAERLITGFGGRDTVRQQAQQALTDEDYRWALELTGWLVRTPGKTTDDATLMSAILRRIAQHSPSANIRNWCLTRALELQGTIDLSRHRTHRFSYAQVLNAHPTEFVPTLRVILVPSLVAGMETEIAWQFSGGEKVGLSIRNAVAVPTDGQQAQHCLVLSHETWAAVLSNRTTVSACIEQGTISVQGDEVQILKALAGFDHEGLR